MNSQSLPFTYTPATVVLCQNSYDPFQDRDSVYTIGDGTFPPDVLNSDYNGGDVSFLPHVIDTGYNGGDGTFPSHVINSEIGVGTSFSASVIYHVPPRFTITKGEEHDKSGRAEAGPYPGWLVGRVGSQLRSCWIGRVGSNDL